MSNSGFQISKDEMNQNKQLDFDFIDAANKNRFKPAHLPSPVKVYTQNKGRGGKNTLEWEQPEWDLAEVGRILDIEGFVRRAFKNKKNLFTKEGYEFTGKNIQRTSYVEDRFKQIELKTGVPFPVMINSWIDCLNRLSNCFVVKVRDTNKSGGKVRDIEGKQIKPIAGYFTVPAETIRFKRDEFGRVKGYKQVIRGKTDVDIKTEDMIHFYVNKREGFSVGTPSIVAVKDDIRALRRIEEHVELLVQQHLFPLFHYKVGTESAPAEIYSDGTSEIDAVRIGVSVMPTDGCWVTPERHNIQVLGAQGQALAVEKVIEHFKRRIFTGLGMSAVDMGEGDNSSRSTAQTMSRNLIDDTKADQKEFAAQFYSYIIQELLLESTFSEDDLFHEENKVVLRFNEIDLESRMHRENHNADLFLKNMITHDELRIRLGLKPFVGNAWPTSGKTPRGFTEGDGDYAHTNYGLFERDKIILHALDEPGTPEAKEVAKSTAGKNKAETGRLKAEAAKGSIGSKNQPSNQHGKRGSAKINKDTIQKIEDLDFIWKQPMLFSETYASLDSIIQKRITARGLNLKDIQLLIGSSFEEAKKKLIISAKKAFRKGIQHSLPDYYLVSLQYGDNLISSHTTKYSNKLREDLLETIDRNTTKIKELINEDKKLISAAFSSLKHRAVMIEDAEIIRAYNYGLCVGFRANGEEAIESEPLDKDSCCKVCAEHTLKYNSSDAIIYEELPPFHPFCTCRMKKKEIV